MLKLSDSQEIQTAEGTQLLPDAIARAFGPLLNSFSGQTIAVAVSGGSDSMALLRLAQTHFGSDPQGTIKLIALTVDHGLRTESSDEAELVAGWCAALGVEHRTLVWHHGGSIRGNLSNAAREARYDLMQAECTRLGAAALLTGHTLDDQAETVLMRLARGSGVDGLSGIKATVSRRDSTGTANPLTLVRPLLGLSRDELRGHLRAIGQDWINDPTNDNSDYDRVKARQMLGILAPLGLTTDRLAATARIMGMARTALETQAGEPQDVWEWSPLGFAQTDSAEFFALPREIALRRLSGVMNAMTGATYRPRLHALETLLDQLSDRARTLHGCVIYTRGDKITVLREPNAVSESFNPSNSPKLWDNRFLVSVNEPAETPLVIAKLGEAGIAQIPIKTKDLSPLWKAAPRDARLSTPALWRGDVLVSAPLAPWYADPDGPELHVKAIQVK